MAYTTINKSSSFMNTKLFTGSGADNNAITGVGFQPDLIWFKNRSTANDHAWVDSIRGARKAISSNNNTNAVNLNAGQDFDDFNADGFTVDTPSQLNSFNRSGDSIATWNFKAGTAASGATTGSGTAKTYSSSSSSTSGFSIVTYGGNATAGHTIPHGCGSAPKTIIVKKIDGATRDWAVYMNSYGGGTDALFLNSTTGGSTTAGYWNDTAPSSSVFTLGDSDVVNGNGNNYIAYCYSDITGYQKSGGYIGNNSTDGPFCYTGHKPQFLLIKRYGGGSDDWYVFDSKRLGYNPDNKSLRPNTSATEADASGYALEIYSHGFKPRVANSAINASGGTYAYLSIGQTLVGSNDTPSVAR